MQSTLNMTELFQYGERVTLQKGDRLTMSVAGEVTGDIYILSSGVCALSSISCDGKEATYLYFKKQQFVGFTPLMTAFNLHHYGKKTFSIVAKTPCVAYRIPKRNFQDLLGFPSVATLMVNTLTENLVYLMEHFHSSKNEPALVQFSRFLLDQAETDACGTLVLDTVFTYQEMACYLGVHSVTIARMVKSLRKEALIDKIGHQIRIINPEEMVKLITEERKIDY
ncbi:Crp/Fnr family transcriptional regulator [Streptococcus gallolyticus]|uniref:Crp/Fnr family transcriptional regulator n=1 Tax=Streptococcus gallolyticus TaxID=315405 RepID=A0A368UC64_9STRE|nr:Crp/Fnr family transcriptional regulator [Streptococcus gallolyticus]RCW16511.1 Crp/Fnr family transcriptional regulator [Streptococcus gallolyticus]